MAELAREPGREESLCPVHQHLAHRRAGLLALDELDEIRKKSEVYEPWEDTSGDAHYDEYEREGKRVDVFNPTLRRVIAAIILVIILLGTWKWITFSFITPDDVKSSQKRTAPLA